MSAIALSPPTAARRRPAFGRLTAVELRKMVDTRAGFWLPVGVALLTVVTVVVTMLTGPAADHTLSHVFRNSLQPSRFLLPVMGVLLVTSEFSQRTAFTTFTLVPRRSRVLAAKFAASIVVSGVALVVCLAVAVIAVAVGTGTIAGLGAVMIPQAFAFLATAMITGLAFGAAVFISAPAIVVYLGLPTVWVVLVGNIHALRHVATWFDQSQTLGVLAEHPLSATEWTHALATLAVWMVVPLLIGVWRLMRHDVA
jgi:ABC-2 type transport system permease protein